MQIKNKYINRYTIVFKQINKNNSLVSLNNKYSFFNNTSFIYKKKNRKGLRINFRNLTLSGCLIGLYKI
jgi:hypothetical protein